MASTQKIVGVLRAAGYTVGRDYRTSKRGLTVSRVTRQIVGVLTWDADESVISGVRAALEAAGMATAQSAKAAPDAIFCTEAGA